MSYTVKEIFYSLHGEGVNVGRAAVFCRFAGCNLACEFCDTDHAGGSHHHHPGELAVSIRSQWRGPRPCFVVLTGGEPTLQVDNRLVSELHALGCVVAMETNGTRLVPKGIDWITVSPKAGFEIVQRSGNELKVVWPQPLDLDDLETWAFDYFYLQPIAGPNLEANIAATVQQCLAHPRWRLSLQLHKIVGIQ